MSIVATVSPADLGVRSARYLLIATAIAVLVSTSLATGLEIAVYIVFTYFPSLRARLAGLVRNPAAIALAIFLAVVTLATLYGEAPWPERLKALSAWRKALLFFFAAAAFDDDDGRRELMRTYVCVCLVAAILSFVSCLGQFKVDPFNGTGILFRNYATQGFAFAIAAGIAAAVLLRPASFAADPILGRQGVAAAALVLFVANVVFVLQGRSSYVVLLVICATLSVALFGRSVRAKLLVGLLAFAAIAGLIAASSVARERIALALVEMQNVESSPDLTSAGIRVVMWKTAARIIGERPVVGVGTGSFRAAYERLMAGRSGWQATPTEDPHNQFLKIWAEQGLIGLTALAYFLIRLVRSDGPQPYRALLLAILLGASASSLFNSHFSTFAEGRLVFFWMGALFNPRDVAQTH